MVNDKFLGMKRSKRYRESIKNVDKNKHYSVDEAIELLKNTQKANFDETVEAHFNLNINPDKSEQQVRGNVELPHGTGKSVKVAVFADNEKTAAEAKKAGALIVGGDELIEKLQKKGNVDFDIAVATPEMMLKLAKIAKILGPKGLMPNPKNETVTRDVAKAVTGLLKGKINFKSDKTGNVHVALGKLSFEPVALRDNYEKLLKALEKTKPSGVKGKFIKSITLSSTMGPGIKLT